MEALPNYLSEWLKSALFNLYEGSRNAYSSFYFITASKEHVLRPRRTYVKVLKSNLTIQGCKSFN